MAFKCIIVIKSASLQHSIDTRLFEAVRHISMPLSRSSPHLSCRLDTHPAEQEQASGATKCSLMLFAVHITQPSAFLSDLVMPLSRCGRYETTTCAQRSACTHNLIALLISNASSLMSVDAVCSHVYSIHFRAAAVKVNFCQIWQCRPLIRISDACNFSDPHALGRRNTHLC